MLHVHDMILPTFLKNARKWIGGNSMTQIKYLTAKEIIARTGLSRAYVYEILNSGRIETLRFGRSIRVTPEAFNNYLEQCKR